MVVISKDALLQETKSKIKEASVEEVRVRLEENPALLLLDVREADEVAIGGGRTLEELVRTSLAPELKAWLDENLPDLVERIVREEVRKMVRRAEDQ